MEVPKSGVRPLETTSLCKIFDVSLDMLRMPCHSSGCGGLMSLIAYTLPNCDVEIPERC